MELTTEDVDRVVATALAEDVGPGDATTLALVPEDARCSAELLLEEPGVVCGVPVAAAVFAALDPSVRVEARLEEGTAVADVPAVLAVVEGPARAILSGERVALNLLGRLCGIASLTRRFVELTEGTSTTVLDTRKTTPGLRALEKYAVRCGGGRNRGAGRSRRPSQRAASRGRGRDDLPGARGARRRGAEDPARQHEPRGGARGRRACLRSRRARGLRRGLARHRPRLRRDRSRLRVGRRPHAFRPFASRLSGGPMTVAATTELHEEVRALVSEKNAVILAHNYQRPEVQDVADY